MPVMPPSDRLVVLRELQRTRAGRRLPELLPGHLVPRLEGGRPLCPKCDGTMGLVRLVRTPSGFDIRTFECTSCDHAQIVRAAPDSPADTRSANDLALDALEDARQMPPGAQRSMALKKAGILRRMADDPGVFSGKGNPRTYDGLKPWLATRTKGAHS